MNIHRKTAAEKEHTMSQQILHAISAVHTRLTEASVTTKEQLSLAAYTTFRIGGPAALAAFPQTAAQVQTVLSACREYGVPCALVGNGSNLLCPDEGFSGCVLFTTAMKQITVDGTVITADAGATMASVCCTARDRGLAGLSFAYGIPGTLGGAVCMNAGAYGGEIGDCILDVTYLDTESGAVQIIPKSTCDFAYRHSVLIPPRYCAVGTSLHGTRKYGYHPRGNGRHCRPPPRKTTAGIPVGGKRLQAVSRTLHSTADR